MRSKLIAMIGLAVIAIAVLQARPALADGIGVFPTEIVVEDAARGGVYYRDLGLTNDGPADLVVEPSPTGEVGDWISVHTLEDRSTALTELAAASGRSFFLLRIEVPDDAANGEHQGSLLLQTRAAGEGQTGSDVSIGLGVRLKVTVSGSQNLQGRIMDMYAGDTEVGYPLRVKTLFENTGNVQAYPKVEVAVKDSSSALVGDRALADGQIGPGENGSVVAEWDTTGRQPADYVADVRVILGDATIDERQLPFKILPVGTLTRMGALEGLTLANEPEPGGVAKIEAQFFNTGRIDTRALFVGEVYYKSALTDTVSTPERLVEQGETVAIEAFVSVPKAGTYTIKGKVNFEGKETEVKELTFDVGGTGGGELPLWLWIVIGAGAVVGAVVIVGGSWALARRLLRSFRL